MVIEIRQMILKELPKFYMSEENSQIRRSSKSVASTVVESYGGREYKLDFLKFLGDAVSSNDETIDNLQTLFDTKALRNGQLYDELLSQLNEPRAESELLHQEHRGTAHEQDMMGYQESFYPEPRTKNPKRRTKNSKPRTKNPEPRTKNQEPRTKNPEPKVDFNYD